MKVLLTSLTCIFLVFSLHAQKPVTLITEIENVTLFPDRAQVYHEGEANLPAGKTILKISGLSPRLIQGTVQVEGIGDFMIMSVNQQMNYLDNPEESDEVIGLRDKIVELVAKIEDENTAIAILKEKENFLVANRMIINRETSINSTEFKALTDQYVSGIESVRLGVLKRTRAVVKLQTEKQKFENQLAGSINRNSMPSGEIYLTLSAEKPVKGKISLNYLVMNAGWYPSYDIRVGDSESPVTIFYKANAYQNTGIDWNDVKLSFSSATPSSSGSLPLLNPWLINFTQQIMLRGKSSAAAPSSRRVELDEVMAFEMEDMSYASAPPVSINTSGTNFSFDLDIPQSVPSTGEASLIEIQRLSAEASYRYKSIPKLIEKAFLTADIPDWEELNLLDGGANIYFGNTFTGETFISRTQLSDTLNISLGKDENITVKREKRKDFTSTRTIGANRQDTRSFKISIRNNRSNRASVDLYDQIPVSMNNQITVEAGELSGGNLDKISGTVKWTLDLEPNESREFIISYTVKYPKNQKVILE